MPEFRNVAPVDAVDHTDHTGIGGGRLAATVLVLRDGPSGLEVWVQERVHTMRTYPGHVVFPGGGVDLRDFPSKDFDSDALWVGTSVISMARRMGVSRFKATAIVNAAVRELFEEAGALLAEEGGSICADATRFHEQRLALESHQLAFSDFLSSSGLKVDASLVHPWARWAGMDKGQLYDTFFFVATLPEGQSLDGSTDEADDAGWFSPRLLLDGWRAGLVRLAAPTWAQLSRLSQYPTVAAALADSTYSDMRPIMGDPVDDPRYRDFFTTEPIDRI